MNRSIRISRLLRLACLVLLAAGNVIDSPTQAVADTATNYIVETGFLTDLAIDGDGWFVVGDPSTGEHFATRRGEFFMDANGYLVATDGLRLQGFSDGDLTRLGDLQIGSFSVSITSLAILTNGVLSVGLADGQELSSGQILLQDYRAPQKLIRVAHRLYRIPSDASPQPMAAPGTGGMGTLSSGKLDVTPEPVKLSLESCADRTGALTWGVLTFTDVPTDLGIVGGGCFLVRNTNTSELFATRAGLFLVDGDGYLITYDRLRVQGYSDAGLSPIGDVRIDPEGSPMGSGAVMSGFMFHTDGKVTEYLSDGTEFVRSQVLLFSFRHPASLCRTNHGLYTGVNAAEPLILHSRGGQYDDGVRSHQLELINVPEDLLAIRRNLTFMRQGEIVPTNSPSQLAISGKGLFSVRNPANGERYVTRMGSFHLDTTDHLVTSGGLRVQGYNDPGLSTLGDICVDARGRPASSDPDATVADFYFDSSGYLTVLLSDGTEFVRGQVLLQNVREPFLLCANESGIYTNLAVAGPLPPAAPRTGGLGFIQACALEMPSQSAGELTLPSRNGLRVRITGEPGTQWTLQATSDFNEWMTIANVPQASAEMEFADGQSLLEPQRFYRVLVTDH